MLKKERERGGGEKHREPDGGQEKKVKTGSGNRLGVDIDTVSTERSLQVSLRIPPLL